MILVGQYDSPFVRRVAVTMNFYRMPFERQVLSVFSDFDAMLLINPLGKVPVLQLDNGERLSTAAPFSTIWTSWPAQTAAWCRPMDPSAAPSCALKQ